METSLIPDNEEGIQTNTESSVTLNSNQDALIHFKKVIERLLHINRWHDLAGTATANFQLTNNKGNEVEREVQQGDHLRIKIPAPGSVTGDGYDWVMVEAIEVLENCVAIRVRPASNPKNNKEDVAHFFDASATSSFVVKMDGNTITAGVYGRNEKPNTDAETMVDKVRNTAIASGAIAGFSKIQWKSLVNGLIA